MIGAGTSMKRSMKHSSAGNNCLHCK